MFRAGDLEHFDPHPQRQLRLPDRTAPLNAAAQLDGINSPAAMQGQDI
jgi:hypothetical protein